MYDIKNLCSLCLKNKGEASKNVGNYDEDKITFYDKLTAFPTMLQALGKGYDYQICADCCVIINNMYEFTNNAVRNINIYRNYIKLMDSNKNKGCKLVIKLKDIGEDADSLQIFNKESNICGTGLENYEKRQHSVMTEIEDGLLENSTENTMEKEATKHGQVTNQEVKIEINECDNLELGVCSDQYLEFKMEIEEVNIKEEYFPNEVVDSESLASSSANQGTFVCDFCKRAFTIFEYYQQHTIRCRDRVYNHHLTSAIPIPGKTGLTNDEEKQYYCDKCDNKFKTENALYLHLRRHSGAGLHTCTECHKQFTAPSKLAQHVLIHTDEKPHKCTQCESAFNQACNLKAHMLTHTGDRPHQCTHCGQTFALPGRLKIHMRTHTGERPFQCTQCGKAFAESGSLTKHRRTHTGEKPYQCAICYQAFALTHHLKRHMNKHCNNTSKKS